MKNQRFWSLFLAFCFLLTLFPPPTLADGDASPEPSVTTSGVCGAEGDGSNVTWTLTNDGTLSLKGNGTMDYKAENEKCDLYCAMTLKNVAMYSYPEVDYTWRFDRGNNSIVSKRYRNRDLDGYYAAGYHTIDREISLTSIAPFTLSFYWVNIPKIAGPSDLTIRLDNREIVRSELHVDYNNAKEGQYEAELSAGQHVLTLKHKTFLQYDYGECSYAYLRNFSAIAPVPWEERKGQIKRVIISPGVTDIRDEAFSGCSELTEAVIPASVTRIGDAIFSGCENLRDVRYLGTEAQWEAVTKGADNDALNAAALHYGVEGTCGDSLTWSLNAGRLTVAGSGDMPDWNGADNVPPWSFYHSGVDTAVLRRGVTGIGAYAFAGCENLRVVSIPAGVTNVGDGAFRDCASLTGVTLPDSALAIGAEAFLRCGKLSMAVLPNGITSIGAGAFAECASLSSATLPSQTANVAAETFRGCVALISVTVPEGVTGIGDSAFSSCAALETLALPAGLQTIGNGAFSGCAALREINVPASVAGIGDSAFSGCAALEALALPADVQTIGNGAFSGCAALREISVPASAARIGDNVFSGCAALKDIHIPEGIAEIGDNAFSGCAALERVALPASVVTVAQSAFSGCVSLTELSVPDGGAYRSDGGALFDGDKNCLLLCPEGKSVYTLPDGVSEIGSWAFRNCAALTALYLPDSLTDIGESAFEGCSQLRDVYYSGAEEQWIAVEIGNGNAQFLSAALHWAFRVQFSPNGGTTDTLSKIVAAGSGYGELPVPVRSGCLFDGWFTEASGGELLTAESVVTAESNHTLYAHWSATNIAEFSSGDGAVTNLQALSDATELNGQLIVPDAENPDEFRTATAFCVLYDSTGYMVHLQSWDVDVSDTRNIRFTGGVRVPEGVEVSEVKIIILSDELLPLQAAGMF